MPDLSEASGSWASPLIVSTEIARQILSGKRSMLRTPARSSKCPLRVGHAYVIQTARNQTSCHITLTAITKRIIDDRPVWELRFKKGDHTDRPRLLAAHPGPPNGDYTDSTYRAMRNEAESPSEAFLARCAANSAERQGITLADRKQRLESVIREIRRHGKDPATNRKLREAERRIRQLPADVLYDLPSAG